MSGGKSKPFLFRLILIFIVLIALEILGYVGMWMNSRSLDFLSNRNYFSIRAMLRGDKEAESLPRYLSLPYLGYIPYPGYQKHNVVQHNADGYRGTRVTLAKGDKFRVLCLGGSTTYGTGVELPTQTYPAQLEKLLNDYLISNADLRQAYKGAEVINGGLEAGNSAEELQQYLFKYRYYKADAVIIQSGINDALLFDPTDVNFQLDYTHKRRLLFHLEPLTGAGRFMMRSYLFSFISIRLFYSDFADNNDIFQNSSKHTYARWTNINIDSLIKHTRYDYYPFYRNSKTLYNAVLADSSALIILPNILNRNSEMVKNNNKYTKYTLLNQQLSQLLAGSMGAVTIPFDFDSIWSPSSWIGDDCHLTANGEKNKAEIVCPYIISAMKLRAHQQ